MKVKAMLLSRRHRRRKATVGAVPGTIASYEGSVKGEIRVIHYDTKSYTDEVFDSVADLIQFAPRKKPTAVDSPVEDPAIDVIINRPEHVTWINIDGVGDAKMLKEISRLFGIHPLAMEDVANVHQHAKMDAFGDTLFFVVRMPTGDDGFQTEQVSLFLIGGVVITIQEKPGDCLEVVRHRIVNKLGRIRRRKADYLTYAVIDAIIDGYFPVIERYAEKLDEAGMLLESGGSRVLPLHLHHIRGDLLLIRKVMHQHRLAIMNVLHDENELISHDTSLYFRDCQDHVQQIIEAVDTDRETCGEVRELYFAMLGEKNNDVMKVLTIIATIFIPMSFVAGVYGMNFDFEVSPLNMPELHWAFGYPFALGLMLAMAGALLTFLYRKGWLSQ